MVTKQFALPLDADCAFRLPVRGGDFKFLVGSTEMLRITADGFYVRGVKVEQGPEEAAQFHQAFTDWFTQVQKATP